MVGGPKAWLVKQRREMLFELLVSGGTIKETALILNYKHPNHLTNDFKKLWGTCPTDLLTQYREKTTKNGAFLWCF